MSPDVSYLGQWFGAGVQLSSMDVKLGTFVPESPRVQQVAVVFDPALDSRVFQHVTWGTLMKEKMSTPRFTSLQVYLPHGKTNNLSVPEQMPSKGLAFLHPSLW